jgi:hypothetical protein
LRGSGPVQNFDDDCPASSPANSTPHNIRTVSRACDPASTATTKG